MKGISKINILLVVALVICGFFIVSCSKKADKPVKTKGKLAKKASSKKKIYMIVKASESEFWQVVLDGAKSAANDLDVELIMQAPASESDIDKQIAILENAISSKPDAIVLAPLQASPLVIGIEDAADQAIPVILIDSRADTDKITSFLASDNLNIGTTAADEMAKALTAKFGKPEGKIACITFLSGATSLEKRKKGFIDQIKAKYPKIEIVDFRNAMGKTGESLNFVQDFLKKYKDLKGIFANNQPSGDETVRALDDADRKDLAVVVVDSGEQEVWGLKNGFVDAMIVQKPWMMGYMGVDYALKAINGEKLPKFVDTGIVAISPAMLKDGMAEEYLNPVRFYKTKHEK